MPLSGEYLPSTAEWARTQAEAFEASRGAEGGELRGVPIIVLTSKGAKTGALRKTALMRVEHGGSYVVVGSKGGAPQHPAWVWNLRKHPQAELQDGAVTRDYRVRELEGAERAVWWERACAVWPDYAEYQTRTERLIPLFLLEPVEG